MLSTTHTFFFNDTSSTVIYTLSLHDALPISRHPRSGYPGRDPGPARREAPAASARGAGPDDPVAPERPEPLPEGARGASRHQSLGDLPDRVGPLRNDRRYPPAHRPGPRCRPDPQLRDWRLEAGAK